MSDTSLHPDSPLDSRYRLQQRLGSGGEVFRQRPATDTRLRRGNEVVIDVAIL